MVENTAFSPTHLSGTQRATSLSVATAVLGLEDIEILKSYLITVWSEWDSPRNSGFDKMRASLCDSFGGIGMGHHRADLVRRLDHVLGELDREFEHFMHNNPYIVRNDTREMKVRYGELKSILLKANVEATTRESESGPIVMAAQHTNPHQRTQDPVQHLCARSLPHLHSFSSGNLALVHFPSPAPSEHRLPYPCLFVAHLVTSSLFSSYQREALRSPAGGRQVQGMSWVVDSLLRLQLNPCVHSRPCTSPPRVRIPKPIRGIYINPNVCLLDDLTLRTNLAGPIHVALSSRRSYETTLNRVL